MPIGSGGSPVFISGHGVRPGPMTSIALPTVPAGALAPPVAPDASFGNDFSTDFALGAAAPTVPASALQLSTILATWTPPDPLPTLPRNITPQAPAAVAPTVGNAVFTGFAPTVTFGTTLAPTVGSAVFTGFAPTITVGQYGFLPPLWQSTVLTAWVPPDPLPTLPRRILPQAPTSAAPSVGSSVFTGFAPTVTAATIVAPSVGSAVFTGFAPAVTVGQYEFLPPLWQPTVLAAWQPADPSPTLPRHGIPQTSAALSPATGSITFTGVAPTVTAGATVAPAVGSVAFTGFAPSVTVGQYGFLPPLWQSAVLAAWVQPDPLPTLPRRVTPQAPANSAPSVGSAVFTGFAPTVTAGSTAAPAVGSVVLTGAAPTVTVGQYGFLPPLWQSTVLAAWQPPDPLPTLPRRVIPQTIAGVNPGAGLLTFTGFAPSVSVAGFGIPSPRWLHAVLTAWQAPDPLPTLPRWVTPQAPSSAAPAVGNATFTGFAPVVTAGTTVAPTVGSAVFTGAAPTLTVGQYGFLKPLWLSTVLAAWTSPDPLPTLPRRAVVSTPAGVNPGAGLLTITGQAPTVIYGATAAPVVGSIAIAGFAPVVAAGATVTPSAGALVLQGFAPIATSGASFSPGAGSIAIAGFAPTVAAGVTTSPAVGSIVFTGRAVSISVPPPWGSPARITRMQTVVVAWQPPDPQPQRSVPTEALSTAQSPLPGREFLLPPDTRTVIDTADVRDVLLAPDTRTVIQPVDIRAILLPADVRVVIAQRDEELEMPQAPPQWSPAASADVDTYWLSLVRWLPAGDTVNTPSVTVVPIPGDTNPVTVGSVSVDTGSRAVTIPPGVSFQDSGPRIQAQLSGGTTGKTYTTILTWHDVQGRTINRQVLLQIAW